MGMNAFRGSDVKRVFGLLFACGAASCSGAFAATTSTPPHARAHVTRTKTLASRAPTIMDLAPADEYFGPLKLSILGIRNTIHDLGARYDVNHAISHQTFASAELTERSIRDWEHHFPRDGQVPKAIYLLERLYTKVLTQESRDRAKATDRWMFADYGSSPQSKQLKKTIAAEHLAPIPVDSPAPEPDTTPSPEMTPTSEMTPAPTASGATFSTPAAPASAPAGLAVPSASPT